MADHPVTEDDVRAHIHALWSTVAPAWAERADYVDQRGAALTHWMLGATDPRPGDHVLELACGAGGAGMAAAPLVAPAGRVVLSDVAAGMVEATAKRVAERGLDGVATRMLDLDDIDEPDATFDVVLCRDGLQFAMEPGRAVREIARVLRPGGRMGLALWAAREHNPWLGLVLDAASEQLGRPVPPPGVPGPFSLSDADRVGDAPSRRRARPGRHRGAARPATASNGRRMVGGDHLARRAAGRHHRLPAQSGLRRATSAGP